MGIRQADLARKVGISASYLNLIEHNRRRIGGKLLLNIAEVLSVSLTALSEGAEGTLVAALREAALAQPEVEVEMERLEDFAGRLPGWAGVVSAQQARIGELERLVSALSDRLTHDPYLSASMHEVLSTVTAIRSTAGILSDTQDIDPDWQRRFQSNIFEESKRLVEASEALVAYLDADALSEDVGGETPQDEFEAFLHAHEYHFAPLENPEADPVPRYLDHPRLRSEAGRILAQTYLERYRREAQALPLGLLSETLQRHGYDPAVLANLLGRPIDIVMRRLATLPAGQGHPAFGLVVADGSGTFTFRRAVEGFTLPRFGAACPIWPLFQSLAQPNRPLRTQLRQLGRQAARFEAFAYATQAGAVQFAGPHLLEATMLLVPIAETGAVGTGAAGQAGDVLELGPTCRVCPKTSCIARREPSILSEAPEADG